MSATAAEAEGSTWRQLEDALVAPRLQLAGAPVVGNAALGIEEAVVEHFVLERSFARLYEMNDDLIRRIVVDY
jgi:hypothetical protein